MSETFELPEPRSPDYSRHLPHYTPNDAPYFITFNLDGAMPHKQWQQRRNMRFSEYDGILHLGKEGQHWMRDPEVAKLVYGELELLATKVSCMWAFTIMSNHVHLLMQLHTDQSLRDVMQGMKGRSARACNLLLERSGAFWQHESYDRVLRKYEFKPVLRYIVNNPVKAGIVKHWEDYPFTFVHRDIHFLDRKLQASTEGTS